MSSCRFKKNYYYTNGSGVFGLGGCCLIMIGGAGGVRRLASCVITISPGAGGVGGRRRRMPMSCMYSRFLSDFFLIIFGL